MEKVSLPAEPSMTLDLNLGRDFAELAAPITRSVMLLSSFDNSPLGTRTFSELVKYASHNFDSKDSLVSLSNKLHIQATLINCKTMSAANSRAA